MPATAVQSRTVSARVGGEGGGRGPHAARSEHSHETTSSLSSHVGGFKSNIYARFKPGTRKDLFDQQLPSVSLTVESMLSMPSPVAVASNWMVPSGSNNGSSTSRFDRLADRNDCDEERIWDMTHAVLPARHLTISRRGCTRSTNCREGGMYGPPCRATIV
jgi:hypothetical protein